MGILIWEGDHSWSYSTRGTHFARNGAPAVPTHSDSQSFWAWDQHTSVEIKRYLFTVLEVQRFGNVWLP